MSANWQQEKEMSNAFWLKLIIKLALKLPRWSIRLLLHPIVMFFILISPNKRKNSRHYLTKVLPVKPRIWHIYKHFFWFSSALLDRVYFLSNQHNLFNITFCNRQAVIDSFKHHPGQFFLSGHFGSVEALRTQANTKQYNIKPVIKLDHNQTIVTLLNQINPGFYQNVIPFKGLQTTFEIYENLKQGKSVALLADRPLDDSHTVQVSFLGDSILLPEGIFEMILRFPYPTNLFFCRYQGGNQYHVDYIHLNIKPEDTPESLAQQFADQMAQQCKKSPYNWFNFYPYWIQSNNA
ncbi:MAG: hypothetical protein U9R28_08630 [Pseudomonadota bacterium]|nr:hypothetical protein [Pseudomonadota bacterium]